MTMPRLLAYLQFCFLQILIKAGVIETDISFTKARISSYGKRIRFMKTGTALGAMDIPLLKPQIVLGETDMFLEVSMAMK